MSLNDKINKKYLDAYKQKQGDTVAVLRLLKNSLANRAKELGRELNDEDVIGIVRREIKQRRETLRYLSDKEKKVVEEEAVKLLESFLPEQLSEDKIADIVKEVKNRVGASDQKDFGRLMGAVMPEIKGRAAAVKVAEIAKKVLNE